MSFFPSEPNAAESLKYIRYLQDWAIDNADADLKEFFQSLVTLLAKVFKADLVTIWDNNFYGNCLVIQASFPATRMMEASHTMPTGISFTGIAAEKNVTSIFPNIFEPIEGRTFINLSLFEEMNLKTLVSVPIPCLSDNKACVVVNLCFEADFHSPLAKEDVDRLAARLGMLIQDQIHKRDRLINDKIKGVAAFVNDIPALFTSLSQSIRELIQCNGIELYSWSNSEKKLLSQGAYDSENKKSTAVFENKKLLDQIVHNCVEKRETLVICSDREEGVELIDGNQGPNRCLFVAAPIICSKNKTIGVLVCREPTAEIKRLTPSFSSFDILAIRSFCSALSPFIERFLSSVQKSRMMEAVAKISSAMVNTYELDKSLQKALATFVKILNSEVGSIYLLDEETQTLKINASYGYEKKLKNAEYRIGEGITGTIAEGHLLKFRSRAELIKHPKYTGKYDNIIWGDKPDQKETFIGIPITSLDKVIAVWKVSNIHPKPDHPEPYYTDEDEQIARVLSSFLAFVIQNQKQEARRLEQFTILASTSLQIQRASDEEIAILIVIFSLEKIGFENAMISLYNPLTKEIVGIHKYGMLWEGESKQHNCQIDDDDPRARVLNTNKEEISDYRNTTQFILPLRVDEEFIGTMQVDIGKNHNPSEQKTLLLKAFASHLSIAISRLRSIRQTIELADLITVSARFLTAETLSAMVVHSIHHKLNDMTRKLRKDLKTKEIRGNSLLLTTLNKWDSDLSDLEEELKGILAFVRSPANHTNAGITNVHSEIQKTINLWINYIKSNNCHIQPKPEAVNSLCEITPEAFREIIAVLIVNSVQAHAKRIEIKTYNSNNVKIKTYNSNNVEISSRIVESAICVECADDGDGILTTNKEEIFEAHYTTKSEHLGTGLGLFVARRLARAAEGDIEIVAPSKQIFKTVFRVTLPLTMEEK
jgi:signal transduction histidine kinase